MENKFDATQGTTTEHYSFTMPAGDVTITLKVDGKDQPYTGIALAIAPAVLAAGAVAILVAKRKH